ncbi:T9SS type A sorting domain-containing protein [Galbibacter sp. EGI 63066]|uniref:T9SS type A sorting domain-containing protein n=1 Tax=Galbibacter sp. EGI 63066 TaxID=2993559 RepID=UPI00224937E4|nr:T9SS type A sorting domain-containing protein [Galbibacter sp. EGI 63066]MCX2679826.1 T9SS type A sorting domain-containing protein [Galbibacter sp. EGI 63066]
MKIKKTVRRLPDGFSGNETISIIDITGKRRMIVSATSHKTVVNINFLAVGVYILEINREKGREAQLLVKK